MIPGRGGGRAPSRAGRLGRPATVRRITSTRARRSIRAGAATRPETRRDNGVETTRTRGETTVRPKRPAGRGEGTTCDGMARRPTGRRRECDWGGGSARHRAPAGLGDMQPPLGSMILELAVASLALLRARVAHWPNGGSERCLGSAAVRPASRELAYSGIECVEVTPGVCSWLRSDRNSADAFCPGAGDRPSHLSDASEWRLVGYEPVE